MSGQDNDTTIGRIRVRLGLEVVRQWLSAILRRPWTTLVYDLWPFNLVFSLVYTSLVLL